MVNATCAHCANAFGYEPCGTRPRKYCSQRCAKAAGRDRVTLCTEQGCDRKARARELCSTHYNRTYHHGSQKRWPAKPEVRARALRDKTRRRRAITRAPEVEQFSEIEIFERDRWRCGICRQRVNRNLAWPHPRSASLDHVVPLSERGPHTRANVRLAHLDCNVSRSNKGGGEQLALIG